MPIGIHYPYRSPELPSCPVDLYPNLPGLTWSVTKVPIWKTSVQESFSGVETRVSFRSFPRWRWLLKYEFLRSNYEEEFQALVGHYLSHSGPHQHFLFEDRSDNNISGGYIGTGDGETSQFQIVRYWQQVYAEPIYHVNGPVTVYVDGAEHGSITTSSSGLITFGTAPEEGSVITVDCWFFHLVRYAQDEAEFENFMHQLWSAGEVELISVVGES